MEEYKEKNYYREVKKGINTVVDEKGIFSFGTYNKAIPKINMLDAKKPLKFYSTRNFKKFRLKEWEAFQAGNDDIFIFGAVYNIKLIALLELIIYDKKNKKEYKYEKVVSSLKPNIGNGLIDSITKCETKNYSMCIENKLNEGKIKINAIASSNKCLPNMKLNIEGYHSTEPIVICQPFGENRGLYSHKNFMPMEGELFLDGNIIKFKKENSFMIIDDHKGYYPWNLKYDWATGWGYDEDENVIAYNLTDNQVLNHEKYNENCIWLNGKMYVLPPIKIDRQSQNGKWIIKDNYGMVNLRFIPEQKMRVKLNLLIIYSYYEAPMGKFEGYFKLNNKKIKLKNVFGMGEKIRYRL